MQNNYQVVVTTESVEYAIDRLNVEIYSKTGIYIEFDYLRKNSKIVEKHLMTGECVIHASIGSNHLK